MPLLSDMRSRSMITLALLVAMFACALWLALTHLSTNVSFVVANGLLQQIESAADIDMEAQLALNEQAQRVSAETTHRTLWPIAESARFQTVADPATLKAQTLTAEVDRGALEDLFVFGNTKRAQGHFGPALYWYELAARAGAENTARYFQAATYLKADMPAHALTMVQPLASKPLETDLIGQSDILFVQAAALQPNGDVAEIERLLEAAIDANAFVDQTVVDALHELGLLYEAARRPADALDAFERAVAKDDQRYWIHVDIGQLSWASQRDQARAESAFTTAMALRPNEPAAYLLLARIYRQTEQVQKAEALYNQVLSFAPNNEEALNGLSNLESGS